MLEEGEGSWRISFDFLDGTFAVTKTQRLGAETETKRRGGPPVKKRGGGRGRSKNTTRSNRQMPENLEKDR